MQIKENVALIDKVIFSGIIIVDIENMDELVTRGVIEQGKTNTPYYTESWQQFSRLSIEHDGVIDKMVAGGKSLKGLPVSYCTLECNVKNQGYGNLACYTVEDYAARLKEIQKHLLSEYGILTDFTYIKVKEIEINRTFKLDGEFADYHRAITVLMNNLPTYLKSQMEYMKVEQNSVEYETYYATSKKTNKSKRYLLLKIYNKSKALENIVLLTDSYMRVELRLIGTEKIKKDLGSYIFKELTDQIINKYFDNQVQKLIVGPLQKWQQSRDKYLINLMKQQRQDDIRHWQTNVLRILQNEEVKQKRPILLDIEELIPLVDQLKLNSKRKSDIKKNFRKQAQKYETVFCAGDRQKLDEIVDKLTVKAADKVVEIPARCPDHDGMAKSA